MIEFEESDQASLINWLLSFGSPEFRDVFNTFSDGKPLESFRFVVLDVTDETGRICL